MCGIKSSDTDLFRSSVRSCNTYIEMLRTSSYCMPTHFSNKDSLPSSVKVMLLVRGPYPAEVLAFTDTL